MSYDRFVYYWDKEFPTKEELEKALTNYISTSGKVYWDNDVLFAELIGDPSDVFDEYARPKTHMPECRWFEVWIDEEEKSVDVLTRMSDEFTSVIATGFAEICARRWRGTRDFE